MGDVRKLVTVKSLEWQTVSAKGLWRADDGLGGHYEVLGQEPEYWMTHRGLGQGRMLRQNGMRTAPDTETAFATCQKDHEARILAAITPASDGRAEGLREAAAWREAATIARDHGFTNAQWRMGGESARGALFHLFMSRAAELEDKP
jgi:hypothetical protein